MPIAESAISELNSERIAKRMIENHVLEQLCAFAEYKTLSAAARVLHTSQPSLTRSMKKLEEDLNVSLFNRSKNRLELNETGKLAAAYAARVLREEQYFEERVISYDRSLHTLNIGYCAPVPQEVFTPLINSLYEGMTISADMSDDAGFLDRLANRTYQLAVTHFEPDDPRFFSKKCGHEDLYISLLPSDPLTFYPEIRLRDLDGKSILLLSRIGFWNNITTYETPHSNYLLQVQRDSFNELAGNTDYPYFSSSYYIRRNLSLPGRINVSLADDECHTDYYLVCLRSEAGRFRKLFDQIGESTIK